MPAAASPNPAPSATPIATELRTRVRVALPIILQLGLLWLLARGYQLENANFLRMFQLAVAAVTLRAFTPDRWHWQLFALTSVAGVVLLLGAVAGAWLLGLGVLLILLAHLPIDFRLRIALVCLLVVSLALLRLDFVNAPWPAAIWPILGSMFMFRYIVYLYDLRHRAAKFGVWHAASYFFMLPNVCFPLFPVVDYKTFVRSWRGRWVDSEPQSGVDALFRGLTQLLLYRLVYQSLMVDVTALESASSAALYLLRPYLLYLKISGSFHVIIGLLNCFGFGLPRTNHNYFLAASFTDYWRRINIYWKDFLQKIVFNPTYFALSRRMTATQALVMATVVAFTATWALHSYQWFWIRGSFPIVWQDVVFWSFMGLVVLVNMLVESRKGRARRLKPTSRTWRTELGLVGATVTTFVLICSSWAVWSVQSGGELQVLVERLARPESADLLRIGSALLLLGALAVLYARFEPSGVERAGLRRLIHNVSFGRRLAPLRVLVIGGALVFLAYGSLVLDYPPKLAAVTDGLRNPLRLSGRDAQAMDRGYYEDLTDVARFNPELAELYSERPPDWERCWAIQRTGGFPTHELLPSRNVAFKGAQMTTNSHGMRDREYSLQKPEGIYRVALHGASHSMGSGVEDDQVFEAVAEATWNATANHPIEILNFSVGGYGPLSRLADLESKIFEFEPDAVLLVGINDVHWAAKELLQAVIGGIALPWPELESRAQEWGLRKGMDEIVGEARLHPHRVELLSWIYSRVRDLCRARGIQPYFLALAQPRLEPPDRRAALQEQLDIALASGLRPLDMLDVYGARESYADLVLAKWDNHPNAQGHAILAERLLTLLGTTVLAQP